jgi:hypothetical protein
MREKSISDIMRDKTVPNPIQVAIKYAIANTKNINSKKRIYDIVAGGTADQIVNFGSKYQM